MKESKGKPKKDKPTKPNASQPSVKILSPAFGKGKNAV
jgi:hypothetical protein